MNILVNRDESSAQDTLIKTNEVLLKETDKWLHFANPHRVVTVQKLEDVLPALYEIDQLIKVNGWYAAGFVSYEAASAFDRAFATRASTALATESSAREVFPFLWFGIYSSPRVISLPKTENPKDSLNWDPAIDRETFSRSFIGDRSCRGDDCQSR